MVATTRKRKRETLSADHAARSYTSASLRPSCRRVAPAELESALWRLLHNTEKFPANRETGAKPGHAPPTGPIWCCPNLGHSVLIRNAWCPDYGGVSKSVIFLVIKG